MQIKNQQDLKNKLILSVLNLLIFQKHDCKCQTIAFNSFPLCNLTLQLNHMLEQGKGLFIKYVKKIRNYQHFLQILDEKQSFIDYKRYNISQLTPQIALQTYQRQLHKYQNNTNLLQQTNKWQVFDKKLFVWFIIIYSYFIEKKTGLNTPFNQIIHQIDFHLVSHVFFGKDTLFLQFQVYNVLNAHHKVIWTQVEDQFLIDAVKNKQKLKWHNVSMNIFFATNGELFIKPKCCKQRWVNHFDQNIKKGKWKSHQDCLILQFVVQKHGKRWSMLKEVLNNERTEHSIKNRYKSLIEKNRSYTKESETAIAKKTLQKMRSQLLQQQQKQQRQQNSQQIQWSKQNSINKNQIKIQTSLAPLNHNLGQQNHLVKQQYKDHNEEIINKQECQKFDQQNIMQQQAKKQEESQQESSSNNMIYPFSSFNYQLEICNYNTRLYQLHKNIFLLFQPNLALIFPYQPLNAPYIRKRQS